MKRGPSKSGFVADGEARLWRAVEVETRRFLMAKYAAEWKKSGFYRRLWLRAKMEKEIWNQTRKSMPRGALCFRGAQILPRGVRRVWREKERSEV